MRRKREQRCRAAAQSGVHGGEKEGLAGEGQATPTTTDRERAPDAPPEPRKRFSEDARQVGPADDPSRLPVAQKMREGSAHSILQQRRPTFEQGGTRGT
jgi:hypothetical protein